MGNGIYTNICIIDGQGGGIGAAIIKRLREALGETVSITALGTNAIATAQMLKARANRGASGENAIVRSVEGQDLIIGPLAIVLAHGMMGEVTPAMATAVASCRARKVLLPLTRESVDIIGVAGAPLPHLLDEMMNTHFPESGRQ